MSLLDLGCRLDDLENTVRRDFLQHLDRAAWPAHFDASHGLRAGQHEMDPTVMR